MQRYDKGCGYKCMQKCRWPLVFSRWLKCKEKDAGKSEGVKR